MQVFQLFWLRETGCDAGAFIQAAELEPSIRERVLLLAGGEAGEFIVRLPFLDRKEWRRRAEILDAAPLERVGCLIRSVLDPIPAARDLAATQVLTDPDWMNTPNEQSLAYFPTWQRVSLRLQRWFRNRIAAAYFERPAALTDRKTAHTILVYQCSRVYRGRPRTDFTYDLRDFPESQKTLLAAMHLIGRPLETTLERIEERLQEAGEPVLARRYSPVWREDIVLGVRRRPHALARLLSAESAFINAVIDLGTVRTVAAVKRFAITANRVLRNVHGMDLRRLAAPALEEAALALTHPPEGRAQDLALVRPFEDCDVGSARGPHLRIGSEEDGNHWNTHGGRQMRNSRVVADVDARGRQPTCQLI